MINNFNSENGKIEIYHRIYIQENTSRKSAELGFTMDMFDNFIEKAKDVCDVATKKTGEFVEVSKIKLDCISINNEIKRLYEKLGSCIYSMVKANYENQDVVDSIIEEIDDCKKQLHILNQKLSELKNINVCTGCGFKNPKENYYCAKCGSRIKSEFTEPEAVNYSDIQGDE